MQIIGELVVWSDLGKSRRKKRRGGSACDG
jgi:hypothetical protein